MQTTSPATLRLIRDHSHFSFSFDPIFQGPILPSAVGPEVSLDLYPPSPPPIGLSGTLCSVSSASPRSAFPRPLALAVMALAAIGLCLAEERVRWISGALLLGVGPGLLAPHFHSLRRSVLATRLQAYLPYAVVLAVTIPILGELLAGRPPITRDHGFTTSRPTYSSTTNPRGKTPRLER